jgi:hypothetical protein
MIGWHVAVGAAPHGPSEQTYPEPSEATQSAVLVQTCKHSMPTLVQALPLGSESARHWSPGWQLLCCVQLTPAIPELSLSHPSGSGTARPIATTALTERAPLYMREDV